MNLHEYPDTSKDTGKQTDLPLDVPDEHIMGPLDHVIYSERIEALRRIYLCVAGLKKCPNPGQAVLLGVYATITYPTFVRTHVENVYICPYIIVITRKLR